MGATTRQCPVPALYNLYIHDIPKIVIVIIVILILYADDTVIFAQDILIDNITKTLIDNTTLILDFYKLWKIKVNDDKTTLTLFTNRKTKQLPKGPLTIRDTKLDWSHTLKYLGMTYD